MKITEHARGRWPEILAALVGAEHIDGKHHPCPRGEGRDRFRFADGSGSGSYFCSCSDGSSNGFDLLQCVHGCDFAAAARMVEGVIGKCPADDTPAAPKPGILARIRAACGPAPRSRYLEARGLEKPDCLLWARKLTYFNDDGKPAGEHPAMVAPVTRDGKLLTYHVTYLAGPRKADVPAPRKLMGACKGGTVALYPAAQTLGIAEGIETAIAARMLFDVPVWAALNTSLMTHWRPPAGTKQVNIYADHDINHAGHAAAYTLSSKLRMQGIATEIFMPPKEDTDWNDMLIGRIAA